jgi:hypothetical protein
MPRILFISTLTEVGGHEVRNDNRLLESVFLQIWNSIPYL